MHSVHRLCEPMMHLEEHNIQLKHSCKFLVHSWSKHKDEPRVCMMPEHTYVAHLMQHAVGVLGLDARTGECSISGAHLLTIFFLASFSF